MELVGKKKSGCKETSGHVCGCEGFAADTRPVLVLPV